MSVESQERIDEFEVGPDEMFIDMLQGMAERHAPEARNPRVLEYYTQVVKRRDQAMGQGALLELRMYEHPVIGDKTMRAFFTEDLV